MGLYLEDFKVGQNFKTLGRTISIVEIVNFICLAGIFEEHFMNEEWAQKEGPFGRRASPGYLTLVIAEGLFQQLNLFHKTALVFLGVTDMRIPAPVLVGDTINAEVEVVSLTPKKPDRGVITTKHTILNQHRKKVMEYTTSRLILRKQEKMTT